jgi:hypothetical protein
MHSLHAIERNGLSAFPFMDRPTAALAAGYGTGTACRDVGTGRDIAGKNIAGKR